MGKKRAGGSSRPAPTLSEQIDRREQAKLLRSAQEKGFAGLTPKEKAAVERHQLNTFESVFTGCPKTYFAEQILGSSSKVVTDNRERRGVPWPRGKRDRINGFEFVAWLWSQFLSNKPTAATGKRSTEEILLEGASPELKDEYVREQIREKQLNRELKELELIKQQEAHLPVEEFRLALLSAAQLIAKKREHLERVLKGEALEQVSRAFEDLADDLQKRALATHDGSDLDEFDRLLAE